MKILAIRLKNLASIEGLFEVDFLKEPLGTAGIFAISGPTGAGKSTILDALCLALYDKTPRFAASGENLYLADVGDSQVNQSDVKNILRRGTGEGFAEVDFLGVTGHRYRSHWTVRRARSKPTGSLQAQVMQVFDLDSEEELQGTKTELLNQLVSLIGLTYEQFTRTVLLAQNDFATFLKSREAAKAELLEKLTGTEIYSRISREVYSRCKQADEALSRLKSAVNMIEILPEEEWQALQKEKERLTGEREKGTKVLAELNAQLNVFRSMKALQEQLSAKQASEAREEEKRKQFIEGLFQQTEQFAHFRKQCEALQPDLRKARDLDIQIEAWSTSFKQAEQSWQTVGRQTKGQEEKVKNGDMKLQVLFQELSQQMAKEGAPEDLQALLASVEKQLAEKEQELTGLQKANDERVVRLDGFGVGALSEEKNEIARLQAQLLSARQQMADWQKAEKEVERLEASLAGQRAAQEQLEKQAADLNGQLTIEDAKLKAMQRLYENARTTLTKDVKALRGQLREGEACPVCGSVQHPYVTEPVADAIFQDIEREFRMATEEYQKSNNRLVALKQDLRHATELQQQTATQLLVMREEAKVKCPQTEEERHPAYFDTQFARLQEKQHKLDARLQEYTLLYKEWKSEDEQVKTLRSRYGVLHEKTNEARLLLQQVTADKEQLAAYRRTEAMEHERFEAVSNELNRLRTERAALLKGKSIDEAETAMRKREKELNESLERARKEVENVQTLISGLQGEIKQLSATMQELAEQSKHIESVEQLTQAIAGQQAANHENERLLSVAEARSLQQVQNKAKLEAIGKELEEKQAVAECWGKLNKLIGSADGTKFKVIAQSYTLNLLLMHANKHLSYLSKRYKLQQVPGTLALQVIDCDMCDEVRTVYSLSGGESFLISLALALGLSSLSSNNLKVESLFIDEGFGSLDADSLRTAMEALEQLQMQGRKIGVISHVQEMSERITVQVQLHKAVNGKSIISVVG